MNTFDQAIQDQHDKAEADLARHGQLPWRRSTVDAGVVFDARNRVAVMNSNRTDAATAAANAELIVRAVNAHDVMLETLRRRT